MTDTSHPTADQLDICPFEGTAPAHLDCPFVPKKLPIRLLEDESVQFLISLVKKGLLDSWALGTQGGHIASRLVASDGIEDILTAYAADDKNYGGLACAHIKRLEELSRE